jgi:uncharacterized delta-60 repeat protein
MVEAVAVQGDGKIVIGGSFTTVAGSRRNYVARLHTDGKLDASFDPGAGPNDTVRALAVQADGRVLIGGSFSTVSGVSRVSFARLHADGSVDPTFQSVVSGVDSLSVQRDGRILVGGNFSKINGHPRNGLGRLDATGALDFSFKTGTGASVVNRILAMNSGRVLLSGNFSTVNSVRRRSIARLLADGSVDLTFDAGAGPDYAINTIAPQPDGKVLIGGRFTAVGVTARLRIARLQADGTLDETFQPGIGMNNEVKAIALAPDGSIVAGGTFSTVAGVAQGGLTRLVGDSFAAPPPVPSGLTATALSSTSVALTWSDLPAEHGWKVERSADDVSGWETIGRLPWDVTAFTDTGLVAGTAYRYRLSAGNPAGDSDFSTSTQARTLTAYEQWKTERGLAPAAPDDIDTDRDGMPLLLEYALGLNPALADSEGRPASQILGNTLTLSYRRLRPEMLYIVESSTDVRNWSASDVNQGSGPSPAAWTPIGLAPQKFLRLRVVQP